MNWPDQISVYHKLSSPSTSSTDSFILDVLILSERHQRVAARCVEDIVVYDYKHANKIPLRPFMLDQFKATWDAQEHTKSKNEFQVEQLVKQVRKLEKESWDKEGAQEDLGGT